MHDRLRAAWPKREEVWPLVGSFLLALIAKAPQTLINSVGTVMIAERMKQNEELLYFGLATYAIFNILYVAYDYTILKKNRVGSSAKANTLYRGLTFLFPDNHKFNAAAAQVGTLAMNIVGINPDLSAPASTAASIFTGDLSYVVANRVSDMLVSGVTQLPYAMYLKRRK